MYIGTVLLRRSEYEFWHMTLRKLLALYGEHKSYNNMDENNTTPEKEAFIDNIF
jgi:hypothetical protein